MHFGFLITYKVTEYQERSKIDEKHWHLNIPLLALRPLCFFRNRLSNCLNSLALNFQRLSTVCAAHLRISQGRYLRISHVDGRGDAHAFRRDSDRGDAHAGGREDAVH
jgi:hypothetical protein